MLEQYQVYKGEDDQWYWRLLDKNGKVVAVAGEGFRRRSGAVAAAKRMPEWAKSTVISEVIG